MSEVEYSVQRGIPASTEPGGLANRFVTLVLFKLPGETVGRTLAISEEQIRFEAGGDLERENAVILRELNNVLAQMTAGTTIDMARP